MLHPDAYLEALYDELQQTRTPGNETREQQRERLLARLKQVLGPFRLPQGDEAQFDPVVLERVELEEAYRERVVFTTLDGLRMPAYVMIPKSLAPGEKRPAALLWHGHSPSGSKAMVGLNMDGSPKPGTGKLSDNLALELARRGLVVLAPDEAGIADRMLERDVQLQDPDLKNSCYNLSVSLLMAGKTTAGLRAYEAIRAADYLASRKEVDAARIGNIGYSGGGTVASLSAALDDRIQASVVGCYPNTYRGSILHVRHCLCNYMPGILQHAEMPDLLGLIAPHPLFIETGENDMIFPIATAKDAIRQLSGLYEEIGHADRFGVHIHAGKHETSGEKSLDWLAETLHALSAGS